MPIKPGEGETQDEFVSRCMSEEKDAIPENDRRLAACFDMWRREKGEVSAEDATAQAARQQAAEVVDLLSHRREHGTGYSFKAAKREAEILVFGEIGSELFGGVSAKTFVGDLQKAGRLDKITVRIHSPGGDIFDGMAIHAALMNHPAPVAVHIDGLAASAASIIAMAGNPILASESASIMLHEPWHMAIGSADDMRSAADVLDRIGQAMAQIYAKRSGKSLDEVWAWMKGAPPAHETWFSAAEAKDAGLISGVIEAPMKVAAAWDVRAWRKRFRNAPERIFEEQPASEPGAPVASYIDRFRHARMTLDKLSR